MSSHDSVLFAWFLFEELINCFVFSLMSFYLDEEKVAATFETFDFFLILNFCKQRKLRTIKVFLLVEHDLCGIATLHMQ